MFSSLFFFFNKKLNKDKYSIINEDVDQEGLDVVGPSFSEEYENEENEELPGGELKKFKPYLSHFKKFFYIEQRSTSKQVDIGESPTSSGRWKI